MAASSSTLIVSNGSAPRLRQPIRFDLDKFRMICVLTVEGALIKDACQQAGIDYFSLASWLFDEDLEEQYGLNVLLERSRRARAWLHMDECLRIADNKPDLDSDNWADMNPESDGKGRPNHEWIARAKLRVETRLTVCKYMAPDIFGGKSAEAINGAEINIKITSSDAEVVGYAVDASEET